MYFRLMGKLNARRDAIRNGEEAEKGFTLIELLVVVIIIGILAAIAIPIYIGIQNSSKDAAVKSDLTNAKSAVVAYYTDNATATTAPSLDTATLGTYGFTKGSYTTGPTYNVSPTGPGTAFCITAPKASNAGQTFYVSDTKGVNDTGC